jgi:hypothetical protein
MKTFKSLFPSFPTLMTWIASLLILNAASAASVRADDFISMEQLDAVGGKLLHPSYEGNFLTAHCLARHPDNQECTQAAIADCAGMGCSLSKYTFSTPQNLKPENRRALRRAARSTTFMPAPYLTAADILLLIIGAINDESTPAQRAAWITAGLVALPVCLAVDIVAMPFEAVASVASYQIQKKKLVRNLTFMLDSSQEGQSLKISKDRFDNLRESMEAFDKIAAARN